MPHDQTADDPLMTAAQLQFACEQFREWGGFSEEEIRRIYDGEIKRPLVVWLRPDTDGRCIRPEPPPEFNPKPGWLAKQVKLARARVREWHPHRKENSK